MWKESKKIGKDNLIYKAGTEAENKHMDTKREREGGGMNWEIGIERYTLMILRIK